MAPGGPTTVQIGNGNGVTAFGGPSAPGGVTAFGGPSTPGNNYQPPPTPPSIYFAP